MANLLNRLFGGTSRQEQIQAQVQAELQRFMQDGPNWTPILPIYPKIDQEAAVKDGYGANGDVYSIISRKALMAAGIPFYVYRVKGKEGRKHLRRLRELTSSAKLTKQGLQEAEYLKTKAVEEVDEEHPINELLRNPGGGDGPRTFYEYCYGYLDATGNTYIYKDKLKMGANEGKIKRLSTLPSQFMQIIPDGMIPTLGVAGYNFYLWGNHGLDKSEVIHMRYMNLDAQPDGSHLYGMTPLQAGAKTLGRSNSAVDSSTAQFQHGGPAGFVYNESMSPNEQNMTQVGALKKKWESETYGDRNRGKVLFSAGKLGYIQTGLSPVDLDILQSENMTFRQLCRIFHMPSAIFNDNEHATMANMEQFYQAAYTDGVLPMVMKLRDAFNVGLLPDFGADGEYFIDADYSGVPVLQQDMKEMAQWLKEAWWITPNEKREYMKFAPVLDANMNRIWVPSGMDTIDNVAEPVGDIGNDVQALQRDGLDAYTEDE